MHRAGRRHRERLLARPGGRGGRGARRRRRDRGLPRGLSASCGRRAGRQASRSRAAVGVGGAVGADDDHPREAGGGGCRSQIDVVPTQSAERTPTCSGHDGQLQEQGQAMVDLFGLCEELNHFDVRRVDPFLEDLPRRGVVSGVAADPSPSHGLAERRSHDCVDPMNASRRRLAAVPAWLVVTWRPALAGAIVGTGRPLARLAATSRPVLWAWRCRAPTMRAWAAPRGELGVEDVEGTGSDLGEVDVVEWGQVASDNPPVLLQRGRRPAPFLQGNPLCGTCPERVRGSRRDQREGARPVRAVAAPRRRTASRKPDGPADRPPNVFELTLRLR
jgi:hypothetical protein